jgi:flavin-dependent dehydrogenase
VDLHCDIIIAGAGPAGAALARLAAFQGQRVMVVDPMVPMPSRLESLAYSAIASLEAMGLPWLLEDRHIARPCPGIRRLRSGHGPHIQDFLGIPGGRGFTVSRTLFDAALRAEAARAGAAFVTGRVRSVLHGAAGVIANVDGVGCVSAPIVVDATGRRAALARRLGAKRKIVERMSAELLRAWTDSEATAAWLDVVPGPEVWTYEIRGPGGLNQQWRVARHGAGRRPEVLAAADASTGILAPAAGMGWLAVGDAAICFDPLTSQGLANALGSALVAAGAFASGISRDPTGHAAYSNAVRATHEFSERGRRKVYLDLAESIA